MLVVADEEGTAAMAPGWVPAVEYRQTGLLGRLEEEGRGKGGEGERREDRKGRMKGWEEGREEGTEGSEQKKEGEKGGRDGTGRDGKERNGWTDGKGKGREGKGREGKGREGKGREGKGREGKGREGKGREGKGREGKGREGKKVPKNNDQESRVSWSCRSRWPRRVHRSHLSGSAAGTRTRQAVASVDPSKLDTCTETRRCPSPKESMTMRGEQQCNSGQASERIILGIPTKAAVGVWHFLTMPPQPRQASCDTRTAKQGGLQAIHRKTVVSLVGFDRFRHHPSAHLQCASGADRRSRTTTHCVWSQPKSKEEKTNDLANDKNYGTLL